MEQKEKRGTLLATGIILFLIAIPIWKLADVTSGHAAPVIVVLPVVAIAAIISGSGVLLVLQSVAPRRSRPGVTDL